MQQVAGHVSPGFEAARDAFAANFEQHADVGAACCVYLDGRAVVDVWAGLADHVEETPWREETIQVVFSATKGATAVCTHLLAERGRLDIDAPIAAYWPEFGCNGKQEISVRSVLCHRAGLAAVDGDLTLEEVLAWDPVVAAIAAQAPNWEPGTAHGYHTRSFGWILGEVVRRVSGRSIGRFFADEIAAPFGLDFHIGLPEAEQSRCARLIPPDGGVLFPAELFGGDSLTARAMNGPANLFRFDEMWNEPRLRRAEMPSSNGVGGARGLARMYAALVGEVDGERILAPATVEAAAVSHSNGPDLVVVLPSHFGLGFMLPPMLGPGTPEAAFGHPGAGGSLGFADPAARLGFGYVSTRMRFDLDGLERTRGLVDAVYSCLR